MNVRMNKIKKGGKMKVRIKKKDTVNIHNLGGEIYAADQEVEVEMPEIEDLPEEKENRWDVLDDEMVIDRQGNLYINESGRFCLKKDEYKFLGYFEEMGVIFIEKEKE